MAEYNADFMGIGIFLNRAVIKYMRHSNEKEGFFMLTTDKRNPTARVKRKKRVVSRKTPGKRLGSDSFIPIKERRIARSRNRSLAMVSLLFFGFVFVYIIQSFAAFALKPRIEVEQVALGGVSVPKQLTGLIIRDETVYRAGSEGEVSFQVSELEHIKKNVVVCGIQDTDEVNRVKTELSTVNEELLKLQNLRGDLADPDGNIRRLNQRMKNVVNSSLNELMGSDYSKLYKLKDSLASEVQLRNQALLSDNTGVLKEPARKRELFDSELANYMSVIRTQNSGIVCTVIDGYEETYTPDLLSELPKELMEAEWNQSLTAKTVKPGDPVFKLINSNVWHIAAYISNEITETWEVGMEAVINAQNEKELPVELEKIERGEKESYVVFRCTRHLEDFLDTRVLKFYIGQSDDVGLKIPKTAVIEKNVLRIPRELVESESDTNAKTAKIYLADGKELSVKIISSDDYAVFVSAIEGMLAQGTMLRKPGETMAEGRSIGDMAGGTTVETIVETIVSEASLSMIEQTVALQGVYRANTGLAEFRTIVINEERQNLGYYILDPKLNRGIKEKDNIVLDAAAVVENQILF
ncbi:MAG: hypothetical protein LBQ68_05445 [Clostridiales bacterium]|jgi:hypothetical protein|nr:hypothetical protein [Clostridiales bacterium]